MKPTAASGADAERRGDHREARRDPRRDPRRRAASRGQAGAATRRLESAERTDRAMSLEVAARDYIWLYDFRHGMGAGEIATREGVSVRQVREGLERARALESQRSRENPLDGLKSGHPDDLGFRLIPLFPIGAFTPQSACPHHGSIERGSKFCCMVCHGSGMDDHPGLRRDPQTDPSPEPTPAPMADEAVSGKSVEVGETRKQRRRRRFAEAAVA